MLKISDMQEAARLIEIDGVEAYNRVKHDYGEETARLLLVAHLRRSFGSMDQGYPPPREIDGKVVEYFACLDLQ